MSHSFLKRLCLVGTVCTFVSTFILIAVLGFSAGIVFYHDDSTSVSRTLAELTGLTRPRAVHVTPFASSELFDSAYANARPVSTKVSGEAQALIVNHHMLAADLVAQAFNEVATDKRRTVLLISPNHFGIGRGPIITSGRDWQTPYGLLRHDTRLGEELVEAGVVSIEEDVFAKEHGIFNIMPFIKKSLPNARVIPIMVNDRLSAQRVLDAAAQLNNHLPGDVLVVGSFDFSHGVTDLAADFHDKTSLEVLRTLDAIGAQSLNIDSKSGLALLMDVSRLRGAEEFVLFNHANAVDYTRDAEMTDVTSYITGAYVGGNPVPGDQATILAFGDLMMDRSVRSVLQGNGNLYPFEHIRRMLAGSDLTVANLEGTITTFEPKRLEPENILFTFDPGVAPALRAVGFDVFSLANNHIDDFGAEGTSQTKEYLQAAEISYFGDYFNRENVVSMQTVRGMRIAFVGFHEFSYSGRETVLAAIAQAKEEADAVIVYPHWGPEYELFPSSNQVLLARQFIDAGADIVLGAHPHVVQPIEVYKGKLIVYSLGNFVFDQQFSNAVKNGLGVGLVINRNHSLEVSLFPYSISPTFQVHLYQPQKAVEFFKDYAQKATASDSLKADMTDGHFTLAPSI
jgi:poly-gamma-glutamate synthesis protein (capsule biosynthesis protein)